MHEASVALSTIEAVKDIEKREKIKASRVIVEVGEGSGVNIDALSFCLSSIIKEEGLNISFEFVKKDITAFCSECNKEITLTNLSYICPVCKNISLNITEGMELNIKEIEGESVEG